MLKNWIKYYLILYYLPNYCIFADKKKKDCIAYEKGKKWTNYIFHAYVSYTDITTNEYYIRVAVFQKNIRAGNFNKLYLFKNEIVKNSEKEIKEFKE